MFIVRAETEWFLKPYSRIAGKSTVFFLHVLSPHQREGHHCPFMPDKGSTRYFYVLVDGILKPGPFYQ
jgi:hypothetical protein